MSNSKKMDKLTEEELEYLVFDNVSFDFDSIFRNFETKNLFENFLDEIYVPEQKSFIHKAQEILKETDFTSIRKLAQQIMNNHLTMDAKEPINVSQQETLNIQKALASDSEFTEEVCKQIMNSINALLRQEA